MMLRPEEAELAQARFQAGIGNEVVSQWNYAWGCSTAGDGKPDIPEVKFMGDPSPAPEGAFSSEGRKIQGERPPAQDEPAPVVIPVKKPGPSPGSRLWVTLLVAAIVAAGVATFVSIGVSILMAAFFTKSADQLIQKDGRLIQKGRVTIGPQGEREVFYAFPYAGPPNLEFVGDGVNWNIIRLKEQKADHFTVQYTLDAGSAHLEWVAEGTRGGR